MCALCTVGVIDAVQSMRDLLFDMFDNDDGNNALGADINEADENYFLLPRAAHRNISNGNIDFAPNDIDA